MSKNTNSLKRLGNLLVTGVKLGTSIREAIETSWTARAIKSHSASELFTELALANNWQKVVEVEGRKVTMYLGDLSARGKATWELNSNEAALRERCRGLFNYYLGMVKPRKPQHSSTRVPREVQALTDTYLEAVSKHVKPEVLRKVVTTAIARALA